MLLNSSPVILRGPALERGLNIVSRAVGKPAAYILIWAGPYSGPGQPLAARLPALGLPNKKSSLWWLLFHAVVTYGVINLCSSLFGMRYALPIRVAFRWPITQRYTTWQYIRP